MSLPALPAAPAPKSLVDFAKRAWSVIANVCDDDECVFDHRGCCQTHYGERNCSNTAGIALLDEYAEAFDEMCNADDRPFDQPSPVNELAEFYLFDTNARFEEITSRFYRETGIMAPGKDVSATMGEPGYTERCERFQDWLNAQVSRVRSLTTERAE